MKINRMHTKKIADFLALADESGCLAVDQWTTGSGYHTKPLALPPLTERYERRDYKPCEKPARNTPERAAMDWFARPENARRKCVYVMDVRKLQAIMLDAILGKEI